MSFELLLNARLPNEEIMYNLTVSIQPKFMYLCASAMYLC